MAADINEITESDRELLLDIQARLIRLDQHLAALIGAWSAGGLRGLREAGRHFMIRTGLNGDTDG